MNKLVTTSAKSIAPATSFADLELVPVQRQIAQRTGLEEVLAAVYRQRLIIAAALALGADRRPHPDADGQRRATPRSRRCRSTNRRRGCSPTTAWNRAPTRRTRSASSRPRSTARAAGRSRKRSPTRSSWLDRRHRSRRLVSRQPIRNWRGAKRSTGCRKASRSRSGLNTRVAQISFTSGDPAVSGADRQRVCRIADRSEPRAQEPDVGAGQAISAPADWRRPSSASRDRSAGCWPMRGPPI